MSTALFVLFVLVLLGAFGGVSLGALSLTPTTVLIILLVALLLGGGGFYWRGR